MTEQALPLIARLTVHALGAVESSRNKEPVDAVAAWMLSRREALSPRGISPAAFSTIRARTKLFDVRISEEVERARRAGDPLCLWNLGGVLCTRWQRLLSVFEGVVVEVREVEAPEVLGYKDDLLAVSPWAEAWNRIARRPHPIEGWTVRPRTGAKPLVLVESVAGRLPRDAVRRLLQRIRYETPDARVVLGLPGQGPGEAPSWTVRDIRAIGWRVEEDISLGARSRLMTPNGTELTPGMYPLRVMTLAGKA